MSEWYQAAQAVEIDTKLDMIHAFQLGRPAADEKGRWAKQSALDKITIKRELLLGYNRFTDAKDVKEAEKRGSAFIAEAERLYKEAQNRQKAIEETKH